MSPAILVNVNYFITCKKKTKESDVLSEIFDFAIPVCIFEGVLDYNNILFCNKFNIIISRMC